jgi:hypothetical protein
VAVRGQSPWWQSAVIYEIARLSPARNVVWITKNRRPKYHPIPLSGGDRKTLARELGKARAMLLPDALKIVMRGAEIVGAVGVSGTPGKDDDCSQACAFLVRSAE